MYKDLYTETLKYSKKKESVNLMLNSFFNPNIFEESINKIDSLSIEDLKELISKNYTRIFSNDKKYLNLFMNEKFLECLIDNLSTNNLEMNKRYLCNSFILAGISASITHILFTILVSKLFS